MNKKQKKIKLYSNDYLPKQTPVIIEWQQEDGKVIQYRLKKTKHDKLVTNID